jgi:hypothetical protein
MTLRTMARRASLRSAMAFISCSDIGFLVCSMVAPVLEFVVLEVIHDALAQIMVGLDLAMNTHRISNFV